MQSREYKAKILTNVRKGVYLYVTRTYRKRLRLIIERRWGSYAALRDGAKPGARDSNFSFIKRTDKNPSPKSYYK